MLQETVGPALSPRAGLDSASRRASSGAALRPALLGRILGSGRVVHRDGEIGFLEGVPTDLEGRVVATGSATTRVIPLVTPETGSGRTYCS
jgi:hypothetical protein